MIIVMELSHHEYCASDWQVYQSYLVLMYEMGVIGNCLWLEVDVGMFSVLHTENIPTPSFFTEIPREPEMG